MSPSSTVLVKLCWIILNLSVLLSFSEKVEPTYVDNCNKLKSGNVCRCLGDSDEVGDEFRELKCSGFENARILKESLDMVRGQSFSSIIIEDGNLVPYASEMFKNIDSSFMKFTRVSVDSTFQMDNETKMMENLHSLKLESVLGLNNIDWDRAFGGFWALFEFAIESSPFSSIPMSAHSVGAYGSYLNSFAVTKSQITCLDDLSLSTLTEATIIDLSRNKLTQIRREALPVCKLAQNPNESCVKLKTLYLSHNLLRFIPENLLRDFPQLDTVFLNGNRLSTLGESVVNALLPNQKIFIDITANPIVCKCESMKWILTKRKNIKVYGTCRGYPSYSMTEILLDRNNCN